MIFGFAQQSGGQVRIHSTLQTQQLGVQALSVAKQNSQLILKLFQ